MTTPPVQRRDASEGYGCDRSCPEAGLLIADEPTKGLDTDTKLQIAELIVGLCQRKASMLLVHTT